jgi:hypothetical protein
MEIGVFQKVTFWFEVIVGFGKLKLAIKFCVGNWR